ncbi:hypothetical protein JCM11251_003075 [Rhodosporidiobolus azoricus]
MSTIPALTAAFSSPTSPPDVSGQALTSSSRFASFSSPFTLLIYAVHARRTKREAMEPSTSAAPPAGKSRRSQFIEKLHDLLENPHDPDSLRWTTDGTSFEITSNEAKARTALAPKWDFRSLSSFIRQLSYYNFKRLSDRRRSTERRLSNTGYIVFTHPTGFFIRGDNTQLEGITRKTRNRPEKSRKASIASTGSGDEDLGPGVDWPPRTSTSYSSYQPAAPGPSNFSNPFGYAHPQQSMPTYQPPAVPQQHQGDYSGWRSYTSPSWPPQELLGTSTAPTGYRPYEKSPLLVSPSYENPEPSYLASRRNTLSEYKVGPGISPRTKSEDLPPVSAASYHPINAFATPAVSTSHATHHGSSASFPSPYSAPAYPSLHSSTSRGALEQPHNGLDHSSSTAAAGPSSLSYRPTGLAMFNPRGSISGEAGASSSTSAGHAAPFYSPYPAPSLPPSPSLFLPHLHHSHTQQSGNEVLPSPTYSSEGEPPTFPLPHSHQQQQGQYETGRMYRAPPSPLGMGMASYGFPSSASSAGGSSATQQSYLLHSASSTSSAHPLSSHPYTVSAAATPSPLQSQASNQQQGYADQQKQQQSGLGWAPPPPAPSSLAGPSRDEGSGSGTAHWGEAG